MYQALYRKYRPDTFDDVVGQTLVVETLKNAVKNNKISHAYLFTGPRGTGKTSIAKILAKTVNCKELKVTTPCNKCVCCTQTNNKQSTDIIEIDAASNNGIDEIREIRNKINLVPSTGKFKIYIIDEVHMLTTGAFNALLKTLEEPPTHIIFILATTEPHKIPTTILSRCQRFDFKKISDKDIADLLSSIANKEHITISKEAIAEIATISDGGLRDAINLLDQANSYKDNEINIEDIHKINGSLSNTKKIKFIKSIIDEDIVSVLKQIDEYNEDGKNLIKVLEEIAITLKNVLLIRISPKILDNESQIFQINKEINENIEISTIINLLETINNGLNNIRQANDPKLAIELLLIKHCTNKKICRIELKNDEKEALVSPKEKEIAKSEKKPDTKTKIEKEKIEDSAEILVQFSKRRIENTLAKFDKKNLKCIKEKLKEAEEYILDNRYAKIVSLIMDGELKATSDEYMLFVYDTEGIANQFNYSSDEIEKFLKEQMKLDYKVVATNNISWEIIKKQFNSKEKEYVYVRDDIDISKIKEKNNTNEELNEYFENIIEYE